MPTKESSFESVGFKCKRRRLNDNRNMGMNTSVSECEHECSSSASSLIFNNCSVVVYNNAK